MLRGERQTLSEQEESTVLRHRISYLEDDLVVPTWNAAFVYDTPSGAQAALEIVEFANSQLLEFRYYDERLDDELAAIYARLQRPRWYDQWIGSRYTARRPAGARVVHRRQRGDRPDGERPEVHRRHLRRPSLRARRRSARLGVWKADVEAKLKTLDDIYRFAVEQSSMSRGQFLELTIVLILVFELFLLFAGVMQ